MLKQFGALPTEERAKQMRDSDYLWCLVNGLLDREEELERVLPLRIRSRLILTELALDGDGAPVGFVFCSILRLANEYLCQGSASVGYLNDLYVSPALRRKGRSDRREVPPSFPGYSLKIIAFFQSPSIS